MTICLVAGVLLCTTLVGRINGGNYQGNDKAVAVAVVPFSWKGSTCCRKILPRIIGNDLRLSGQFKPLPSSSFLGFPSKPEMSFFDDWRRLGASYLMVGRVAIRWGSEHTMVNYELFDVLSRKSVLRGEVTGKADQLRSIAHRISDDVYEKITGIPGIFSTRILYVVADRKSAKDTNLRVDLCRYGRPSCRADAAIQRADSCTELVTGWQEGCLCLF